MKGKSSLYAHVFNNKVQNQLIFYLEGQKRNLSSRISNLKEPWTVLNLKVIQSIFHPNQMYSHCHFLKEVSEYFSKRLKKVKDKYHKCGEDEFHTNNYDAGQVSLGWSK